MSSALNGDDQVIIEHGGSMYSIRLRRDNATRRVSRYTGFDSNNVHLGDFQNSQEAIDAVRGVSELPSASDLDGALGLTDGTTK